MPKLLALFKIADDRNLRTSFVLTFLSSKRREPSIGWKNIAFPWHGSAPAAFVFLLTNLANVCQGLFSESCTEKGRTKRTHQIAGFEKML